MEYIYTKTSAMDKHRQGTFQKRLKLFDATAIVAGSMIGSGIYIVSADISRNVGSPGWLLLVWLVTGVLTVIAALTYGELSSLMPHAGGQYVFLKEAYNPLIGFCVMLFCLITSPCMATVAVTRRESNSWKWALLQFFGLTAIGWGLTFLVYQTGMLLRIGVS